MVGERRGQLEASEGGRFGDRGEAGVESALTLTP